MRVPKGFSGILLIKRVWDGSFIIHYEDDEIKILRDIWDKLRNRRLNRNKK